MHDVYIQPLYTTNAGKMQIYGFISAKYMDQL